MKETERNLRSSASWDVTQRGMVVFYRRFGTKYRSHFQGSSSPKAQISFTSRRKPEIENFNFMDLEGP